MGRPKKSMADRQHGVRATYLAGCRCADCVAAHSAYNRALREKAAAKAAAADAPAVVHELRIPVSCHKCGSGLVQLTPSAVTDSGLRTTAMFKCADKACRWEWQVTGVMMSRTATEYAGAAG